MTTPRLSKTSTHELLELLLINSPRFPDSVDEEKKQEFLWAKTAAPYYQWPFGGRVYLSNLALQLCLVQRLALNVLHKLLVNLVINPGNKVTLVDEGVMLARPVNVESLEHE